MYNNIILKSWLIDRKVQKLYRQLLDKYVQMSRKEWNRRRNRYRYKNKKRTFRYIEKVNKIYENKVSNLEQRIKKEYMSLVATMCIQQLDSEKLNIIKLGKEMDKELKEFSVLLRSSTKHNRIDANNRNICFIKGINKMFLLYYSYYPKKSICNDLSIRQVLEIMSKDFKGPISEELKNVKSVIARNKMKTLETLIVSAFVQICKFYYIELYDYERCRLRYNLYKDLMKMKSAKWYFLESKKVQINKLYENLKSTDNKYDINKVKYTFRWGAHKNDVIDPRIYNTLIDKLNPIVWIGSYSSSFVNYYLHKRYSCVNGKKVVSNILNDVIELLSMHYRIDITQFWLNRDSFIRRVNYQGMERWYITYHLGVNDLLQDVSRADRKYIWGINTDLTNLIVVYNNWPFTNYYIETEYNTSYYNYMF